MAGLPSYAEATARKDWLELAAPYVPFKDYYALCLVDRRSWEVFAPRLWGDLLNSVRRTRLDPGDDIKWWIRFVFDKLDSIDEGTRGLVRILDTRDFANESYNFQSYQQDRTLLQSFRKVMSLCPNINSVVLDHHEDINAGILADTKCHTKKINSNHLRLLSLVGSNATAINDAFFSAPAFDSLIYLDVSWIVGSIRPLLLRNQLHSLRILKVRGREIDNFALNKLVDHFRLRLWSLDISNNKMDDAVIDVIRSRSIAMTTVRSDAHFRVEGRVVQTKGGTKEHGVFHKIVESETSQGFIDPERYFVDAPIYAGETDSGTRQHQTLRNDGRHPIRKDLVGETARVFSGQDRHFVTEDLAESKGLTHLRLSNTGISALGISKLLRESNGHLENLDIALNPLLPFDEPAVRQWPKSAKLYGLLGMAHLLRPVFSSNLRALRVHHSLVTQIPTLAIAGMSTLARDYLSETLILTRAEAGFAEPFQPDMNPRLTSLTLTCIPRRSSGPLFERLIKFLKCLSHQERAIWKSCSMYSSRRSPGVLEGLRHLRLEFEPDAREDGFSTEEDLDAQDLMATGETGFSFFESERTERTTAQVKPQLSDSASSPRSEQGDVSHEPAILGTNNEEYSTYHGIFKGEDFSVSVWIGPRGFAHNIVISDYRQLVLRHNVKSGVGPVTPSQVLAGAPAECYIFHTAWHAAIMPPELKAPPIATLAAMKDVLEELRVYRNDERKAYTQVQRHEKGSHGLVQVGEATLFWTGTLEVVTQGTIPQARAAQYWR